MPNRKNGDHFLMPTSLKNGKITVFLSVWHFWVGFEPIFKNCIFVIIFDPFLLLYGQKTKSAQGQRKERLNKKVEENKPALKLNFLSKSKRAGLDFEIKYIIEP